MRFSLLLAPGQTAHAPSLQYGPFCACATITVWTNLRMRHHYSTGQTAHTPPLQYTEDYVRCSGNLINLSGPGVTVCPLVQVPLSGVGSAESIRDMANLDSWILSAKLPRNIVLSESREKLWASLCSSASAFLDQSPPCSVLYLPISLNNARKKRFSAGSLAGEFPEEIDAVDCNTESAIISSITRELNDCYCLHLPSNPSLQRDSELPLLEHGTGRLVLVGASRTSRMSALLPASLESFYGFRDSPRPRTVWATSWPPLTS